MAGTGQASGRGATAKSRASAVDEVRSGAPRAPRPRHASRAAGPLDQLSRRATFVVGVLGNKKTAELLKVAESQPSRWRRSDEFPSGAVAPLLVDLDHVIGRLVLVWDESLVSDWLTSPNSHLEGARPIDVLALRGSAEVVEAIEAEASGAYA